MYVCLIIYLSLFSFFFLFKCNKLLLTIALDKRKEDNFKVFFIVHNLV